MKKVQHFAGSVTKTLLGAAVFYFIAVFPVYAQDKITPSHVYQSTEQLRAKLVSAGHIDIQLYESVPQDTALRHPRHVMQKVRECHAVISKIIKDEGIVPSPLPALVSLHEIRPSDVKNGVEHLLAEVNKLDSKTLPPVPFVDGKLPVDVYNNLRRICFAINTSIAPADIYRFARVVRNNVDKIAAGRGYDIDVAGQAYEEKTPAEVYDETRAFLDDLRTLALNADFAIPGGVILPKEAPDNHIDSKDVVALVNDGLSDSEAIKYALGVGETVSLPEYEEDKTLSDVFDLIYGARQVVQQIIALENSLVDEVPEE